MFKRLARKWAIPGWIVLAFGLAIELLDWWHRIEFVSAKVMQITPSLHPVFEWIISGQGRFCIMLLGFVLVLLAVWRKEQPRSVPTVAAPDRFWPKEVEPQKSKNKNDLGIGRVIVDVTPEYLMSFFAEHTSIQAQRLIEPYIGKWMKVSGPLGNVSNNEYFAQVVFEHPPRSFTAVYMRFRQSNRSDYLSVLRRGTQLTVLGQIQEVTRYELQLDNCEHI